MTSLPTPSTSGDDHDPKAFKRDRKSDDITAIRASVDGSGGGSAYCSKVNAIIGIDADVEAEVNFVKKLYLVLYAKSRICLAINLPVSLWAPVSMVSAEESRPNALAASISPQLLTSLSSVFGTRAADCVLTTGKLMLEKDFNITAPLGPSPPHLQDQSHPR
ncbi:unnamed protein product [Tilletia controversa]|uniref:Uncharacterized protein n=1 Tax=Tilletia controversa TaxID=13291 RepID=A0A8X7SUN0_9BASI|nr:hypothetical protein CF328_g8002 [Tilletia controversa]KAE8243327.1 hypothetical protein A4X06_0g6399 [Tilletia controversa]CAD6926891.1 unnamed protein product [Tilletia controversa]CAD6976533.1 unnamed protein product [Tilletia controversa]